MADLGRLLERERRLEPARALALAVGLAGALDRARWARGLVHGHLGPGEVLLAGERALLMGFGLRRELPPAATLAEAASRLGADGYPAPEQIEGRPLTPSTDVYALGCLLFECLTGRPPFTGDTPEAVLEAHLAEPPPAVTGSRPELRAALDPVLERALAKAPEERHPTCEELAAAARHALAPDERQPEPARKTNDILHRFPVPLQPERAGVRSAEPGSAAIGLVALLAALLAGAICSRVARRATCVPRRPRRPRPRRPTRALPKKNRAPQSPRRKAGRRPSPPATARRRRTPSPARGASVSMRTPGRSSTRFPSRSPRSWPRTVARSGRSVLKV